LKLGDAAPLTSFPAETHAAAQAQLNHLKRATIDCLSKPVSRHGEEKIMLPVSIFGKA
jgi:hypothetical protein